MMRFFLMVAALAVAVPAAADAQRFGGSAFGASGGSGGAGRDGARSGGQFERDGDRDRRDRRRRGNVVYIGDYDRDDYDPDRAFRPDGYNDWWHDRPSRAYPAWVARNNAKCERMWWSGGGWTC